MKRLIALPWFLLVFMTSLAVRSQPSLSIQRMDGQKVQIGWPAATAQEFVLEQTAGLEGAARWQAVNAAPVSINDRLTLTLPIPAAGAQFFRLHQDASLTSITASSPGDGETGVAVTRETIVHFSSPLATNTVIRTNNFYATAGGRRILSRIELSSDHTKATLFYLEPLPGSTRVSVIFDGEGLKDSLGRPLDPGGSGQANGFKLIQFDTLSLTPLAGTAVIGRVFAAGLLPGSGTGTNGSNKPLAGVTITVDGMEQTLRAVTDATGNFKLEPAPPGRFFVHIDGRTVANLAEGIRYPDLAFYPLVGKAWSAVAGRTDNQAGGTGEIYLPLIEPGTLQPISSIEDTKITFPPDVVGANPALAGVTITVPANSLFSDDGTRGGKLGIAPVPPDRLPGPLPPGLEFPIVITVQTDGPLNFDRPAPVCFPNLVDPVTKQPLPAGAKQALISFNHKKGIWEAVGSMTVSADGRFVCSDPGFGIRQPGWHGFGPRPKMPRVNVSCRDSLEQCLATCQVFERLCNEDLERWVRARMDLCFRESSPDRVADCLQEMGEIYDAKRQGCIDFAKACQDACLGCSVGGPSSGRNRPDSTDAVGRLDLHAASPTQDPVASRITELLQQAVALISGFTSPAPIPESVVQQIQSLVAESDAVAGGSAVNYLTARIITSEERLLQTDGRVFPSGNAPPYSVPIVATVQRPSGLFYLRTETEALGEYSLFVPRDGQLLDIAFFDPRTGRYGGIFPLLTPGQEDQLPRFFLAPLAPSVRDTDRDGLADVAEFVLGTERLVADTDGDGIKDGAEVDQGTNPLDGLPVRTGVIASVDTPGKALDVCVENDLAVVADGESGVAVFNVSNGMAPVRIAQVDTPGTAQEVACSGRLIAVADGEAGLAIIDIADPSAAHISRQLSFTAPARTVVTAGQIAYVGLHSGEIAVVDLLSGSSLGRISLPAPVQDLAWSGDYLYALTPEQLHVMTWLEGSLKVTGTVDSPFSAGANRRVFVGDRFAYVTHGNGYNTFGLENPAQPLLRTVGNTTQFGWRQLTANGSGLGLAVVGTGSGENDPHAVSLYDLSVPTTNNLFLTTIVTPGNARAISIYNGLAYVADDSAGLEVINYLEYDRFGKSPAISLSTSFVEGKAEEGKPIRVSAHAQDDVQVRNVEFYLDNQKVATDGNFPFEYRFTTPFRGATPNFTLRAKATDTGGNATWTDPLTLVLVADATPPRVLETSPRNGALLGPEVSIAAYWSEPMNRATITSSTFQIASPGPDGSLGTPDDLPVRNSVVAYKEEIQAAFIQFEAPLAPGRYRAEVSPPAGDLVGNPVASTVAWIFEVPTPIGFGQTIGAVLTALGERNAYSFEAEAGDIVRVRMSRASQIDPTIELLDLQGRLLTNATAFADAIIDFPIGAGGTYYVWLSDREGDEIGAYGVFLERLNGPAALTPIQFGQTLMGGLSSVGKMDTYSFQAQSGDVARVRMSRASQIDPTIELLDLQGRLLTNATAFADAIIDFPIGAGGTYYVLLSDRDGDETGDYGISLERLNGPAALTPIQFGQTLMGGLSSVGEMDAYSFQAQSGDAVRVRMSRASQIDPTIELLDLQGRLLTNATAFADAIIDFPIGAGGTYYVLLSDRDGDETGDYGISVERLNGPAALTPIQFGQTLMGGLSSVGEMDAYSFQAQSSDVVRVRMSRASQIDPTIELLDLQGRLLTNATAFADAIIDFPIGAGGTYYVLLSDRDGDETGDYGISLERLNGPAALTPIQFGQTLMGGLSSVGEMDAYSFQAQSGDVARVRMSRASQIDPTIELLDLQGRLLTNATAFADAIIDFPIGAGGTYYVLLSDRDGDETGDYGISVERLNGPAAPTPIQFGQTLTSAIDLIAELDAFAFEAQAGDSVTIEMSSVNGIHATIELFDMEGRELSSLSASGDPILRYQLTASGTYFLRILVSPK